MHHVPGSAVVDDLGNAAPTERDHRRSAGHRLDHDHAEGLVPGDREEHRGCAGEELALLRGVGLPQVDRVIAQPGCHLPVEVLPLGGLDELARESDPPPAGPCGVDRGVGALLGCEPADPEQISVRG